MPASHALERAEAFEPTDLATRHALAVHAALARALRAGAAPLTEPRVLDPARAFELLGYLVETIVGVALGSVYGDLLAGARRWLSDDLGRALHARARAWPGAGGERPAARELDAPRRYLDDADQRPLVDELARRLHLRFLASHRDVSALVEALTALVEQHAPAKRGLLDRLLAHGAADDALERRVAEEIGAGWRVFQAVAAGARPPSLADLRPRSQALWRAWLAQVERGPACRQLEPPQDGAILRVA